jgi:hypothetical protein
LFPVKLGPRLRIVLAALVGVQAPACGYRSAVMAPSYGGHLSVAGTAFTTPHPEAAAAALFGAREELSSAGVLGGQPYPRLVVEVVRVDELPAGISAQPGGVPLGRGSDVGVTAHGWIQDSEGAAPSHDTGDVRRVETVALGNDAVQGSISTAQAVRSAAMQAGRAVARRALGRVEPAIEPM